MLKTRDRWICGVFLFGVAVALSGQPVTTYSWMWNEAKDAGHEFAVGLLDISQSRFDTQWKVVEGGNQAIDLSDMIPGDARQLEASLSRGNSDLDFRYKIVAEVKDGKIQGSAEKLSAVLRIRIEQGNEVVFEGPILNLAPQAGSDPDPNKTESFFSHTDPNRDFKITVYLPETGVDASLQGLAAQVSIRFLAKQATPGSIYGG